MALKKIIPAVIMAVATSASYAGGFDGPFVQLGIGGSSTSTKVSGTQGLFDGTSSQGSVNGLLAAGWSQSIGSEGFNLGANIFYVIGNQNAGSKSQSGDYPWENGGYVGVDSINSNQQNKLKGTFGISVEPGWNFTDTTLGFVKLAWVNSRLNSSLSYSGTCTVSGGICTVDPASENFSKTINGFGYGLGGKQLITKNVFVGIDLMGVTYGSASYGDGASGKPSQFMGFASVGYKF